MKRRAPLLLLFLIAGILLNVAVAWHFARWPEVIWSMHWENLPADAAWLRPMRNQAPAPLRWAEWKSLGETVLWRVTVSNWSGGRPQTSFVQVLHQFGLPFRCFEYEIESTLDQARGGAEVIALEGAWTRSIPPTYADFDRASPIMPRRPLWPGLVINSVAYAAVLWIAWIAPLMMFRLVRRRRRIKRGLCPACAYPAGTGLQCSECGGHLNQIATAAGRSRSPS